MQNTVPILLTPFFIGIFGGLMQTFLIFFSFFLVMFLAFYIVYLIAKHEKDKEK